MTALDYFTLTKSTCLCDIVLDIVLNTASISRSSATSVMTNGAVMASMKKRSLPTMETIMLHHVCICALSKKYYKQS